MCIANHPVLYDLHMQELERSCAAVKAEGAAPAQAGALKEDAIGFGGIAMARRLVWAVWLRTAGRRIA